MPERWPDNQNPVLFVGGVSAAGKSTLSRIAGQRWGLPVLELDRLYAVLCEPFGEAEPAIDAAVDIARRIVPHYLKANAPMILEGGWLMIEDAARLALEFPRFRPLILGYRSLTAEQKWRHLEGASHWVRGLSDGAARDWLQKQCDLSREYEAFCARAGLPYFDLSDFAGGSGQVLEYIGAIIGAPARRLEA